MSYLHIENLYKKTDVLLFKECFCLEKLHGTSAHINWNNETQQLTFFSGGAKHESFIALFDQEKLKNKFVEKLIPHKVTIYGEAYGGKLQGMSATYGKELKFCAFDVKIGDYWLNVPRAEAFVKEFDLEFVHYVKIPTTLEAIDAERDADSVQAIRNGMSEGRKREGVILRPLIEFSHQGGGRIICKHKRDDFKETKTPREVNPEELKVLEEANAIADEWVTFNRLEHILDKIPGHSIEHMRDIILAMIEDVLREGEGEISLKDEAQVKRAIGKKTAKMFKERMNEKLKERFNEQAQ